MVCLLLAEAGEELDGAGVLGMLKDVGGGAFLAG